MTEKAKSSSKPFSVTATEGVPLRSTDQQQEPKPAQPLPLPREDESYVGIAPCGCVRAACVDSEVRKKDTAKFVAGIIREGLRVELWGTEKVRQAKWACQKCDPEMHQTFLALEAKRASA